ncbi:DDE-type integrase/transposase/recombinase [Azospirillum picis]
MRSRSTSEAGRPKSSRNVPSTDSCAPVSSAPSNVWNTNSLWRAVDQDGFALDTLVQSRRDTKAAKRLLRKLLKKQGRAPRVPVSDKLKSYAAAKRKLGTSGEHRQHKGMNNRAETSHQPTRRRERQRKRFKDPARSSASWPFTTRPPTSSISAATIAPLPTIGRPAPRRSRSGPRPPARRWRHKQQTPAICRILARPGRRQVDGTSAPSGWTADGG